MDDLTQLRLALAAGLVAVLFTACHLLGKLLGPVFSPAFEPVEGGFDGFMPAPKDPTPVVLAGSMNPPHIGHLSLIRHLHRRHGRVLVAIGYNTSKSYAVTPEERADALRAMCEPYGMPGVSVHVVGGFVWRFAFAHGATALYRGVRGPEDARDEVLLHLLNQLGPPTLGMRWPLPTRFLQADPAFRHVSSTLVRTRCSECASEAAAREQLSGLVPPGTESRVWALYGPARAKAAAA